MAIRLMTGAALGIEIAPAPGVYVTIYLGIIEIAIFNPEELEE